MSIRSFGHAASGEEVFAISLDNGLISCEIISFGAVLRSLRVPDRNGKSLDVVLGYDTLAEYETNDGYLGAVVGRCANRIAKGRFALNGEEYRLAVNNGPNHLHGGLIGFSHRVWNVEMLESSLVKLSLESFDGEEAYPGNMKVSVTYSLEANALKIKYEAISDADTICNLTNHSYFNLAGHGSGDVLEQEVKLYADFYTPTDADSIPTGELANVAFTPMDLREFTPIGKNIESDFIQLVQGKGYDHNYVLAGDSSALKLAAEAGCRESGILMQLLTTMPGVQFYTANYIEDGRVGKDGKSYGPRHGFCFETQFYPDSPNKPEFPTVLLKAGEKYEHSAVFSFGMFA